MSSRADVTARYAKAYRAASKKDRGRLLDEVVAVTGWSRDNARRRLAAAAKGESGQGRAVVVARRRRGKKYSYDALKVLQRVLATSGGQCGKYLAESMPPAVGQPRGPRRAHRRRRPVQPGGAPGVASR